MLVILYPITGRWVFSQMMIRTILLISFLFFAEIGNAEDFNTVVPLRDIGTSTYYVEAQINGHVRQEFMLDTGSAHVVIDNTTLNQLKEKGNVEYLKDLTGKLADGSQTSVPLYRVDIMRVGQCVIRDVEVAVFPKAGRNILGLSALKKVAPISISVEPPSIKLSNCQSGEPAVVAEDPPESRTAITVASEIRPVQTYSDHPAFILTSSSP